MNSAMDQFGVVMTIVERPDQVEWAVQRLRRIYESVPLTLISDGDDNPRYPMIADAYGGTYQRGKRLKTPKHGAKWWERVFRAGLTQETPFVLKIDPDTSFNRPIRHWPEFDCFGTVTCRGSGQEHIQGGIQGFRRSAIEKIVASGICLRREFQDVAYWAWDSLFVPKWREQQYLSTDQLLRRVLLETSLSWGDWSEVRSWWMSAPSDPERFAITHAHKWMALSHRLT